MKFIYDSKTQKLFDDLDRLEANARRFNVSENILKGISTLRIELNQYAIPKILIKKDKVYENTSIS